MGILPSSQQIWGQLLVFVTFGVCPSLGRLLSRIPSGFFPEGFINLHQTSQMGPFSLKNVEIP